jgi:hypothetical protein
MLARLLFLVDDNQKPIFEVVSLLNLGVSQSR